MANQEGYFKILFRVSIYFLSASLYSFSINAQKSYRVSTIAFYNLENLFDTLNDPLTFDDERTPTGRYQWTRKRYQRKLINISKVLSEIGTEVVRSAPDIIGICEVENRAVIEDLISQPALRPKNYGIMHYDSPDERGIDLALLYRKNSFLPLASKSHRLLLYDPEATRKYTRDQLVVQGILHNEELYFVVNHWPSRSGGVSRSSGYRLDAAKLNRRIIDSIQRIHASAKIIVMGDFNDDPVDDSLKKVLRTEGKKTSLGQKGLFNPMERLFKKGSGSLAYRDRWNLFDQIFFTANLLNSADNGYRFWKGGIFQTDYLVIKRGKFKGYPFRTFSGSTYSGGYSDHFPVFIHLIKRDSDLKNQLSEE